jgi:membrane protein YqaA with SNARE-associated domain
MEPYMQNLISTLAGVIVGSLVTSWIAYAFQKKLLRQQLEAQEMSHQEMLSAIKAAAEEARERITSAIGAASQRSRIS